MSMSTKGTKRIENLCSTDSGDRRIEGTAAILELHHTASAKRFKVT